MRASEPKRCGCYAYLYHEAQHPGGCPGTHTTDPKDFSQCETLVSGAWGNSHCLTCLEYRHKKGIAGCPSLVKLRRSDGGFDYVEAKSVMKGLAVVPLNAKARRGHPLYRYAIAHEASGLLVAYAVDLRTARNACRRLAYARDAATGKALDWTQPTGCEKYREQWAETLLRYYGSGAVLATRA